MMLFPMSVDSVKRTRSIAVRIGGKIMLTKISQPKVKSAIRSVARRRSRSLAFALHSRCHAARRREPCNLKAFSLEIGKERFTSIDKVEDDGMSVYGRFHSDKWATLKIILKFQLHSGGKFNQLEIGQANY